LLTFLRIAYEQEKSKTENEYTLTR
jgi:hypothetical protein